MSLGLLGPCRLPVPAWVRVRLLLIGAATLSSAGANLNELTA